MVGGGRSGPCRSGCPIVSGVVRVERRKALGAWPGVLRCSGRRAAPTALRCSVLGGERRTRPRTGGILLRRLPVLGAQTGYARPLALRRCATPRALALLGAAEAHARPPAHGFARNHGCSHRELSTGSRRGAGGRQAQRLLRRRAAQTRGRRALARASSSDSSRLFERSERSERSEFCDATAGRAAQGSRRLAATAAVERSLPPTRTSARAYSAAHPRTRAHARTCGSSRPTCPLWTLQKNALR